MPAVWFALKKSFQCRSEPSDVYDPKVNSNFSNILTKKSGRSGCSRSISNLKDVIHGSKRYMDKPPTCSPRSIGSNEFLNPITHEVVFSDSTCEIKITGVGVGGASSHENRGGGGGGGGSAFVGTVRPGTPGPGGHHVVHHNNLRHSFTLPRHIASSRKELGSGINGIPSNPRVSFGKDSLGSSTFTCQKCGEQFAKCEAVEAHHLSKHAVTELVEGDSSRKIVELICQTGWLKSDHNYGHIERILKIHNMQKTIARFEEYRETVKIKATKLQKKHPRCLADGNELLRFCGSTVECQLGLNGSSSLCLSSRCNTCQILRLGFSAKKEMMKGGIGVFTTSTSGRALESIDLYEDDSSSLRKVLIVCRVIAGRVHRPLENFQELAGQSGFDSLAGKMGVYSNIEELFLLNPRALLPCFVVIFKP
ncbi:hypothetical protein U1Q18_008979 [Sarracenia purpurea var. burkii]